MTQGTDKNTWGDAKINLEAFRHCAASVPANAQEPLPELARQFVDVVEQEIAEANRLADRAISIPLRYSGLAPEVRELCELVAQLARLR